MLRIENVNKRSKLILFGENDSRMSMEIPKAKVSPEESFGLSERGRDQRKNDYETHNAKPQAPHSHAANLSHRAITHNPQAKAAQR